MKLSKKSIALRTFSRAGIGAVLLLAIGGLLAAVFIIPLVLVVAAYEYLYWKNYEFSFEDDDLTIESGVITKTSLDIPVRRIQDIDTTQSVLPRLFDVVQVDVQTAGGNASSASLRYLEEPQAELVKQRLRELQDRREGTDDGSGQPRPAETVYHIGDSLLTYSLVRSVPAALGSGLVVAVGGIGVAASLASTTLQMVGFAALAIGGSLLLAALVFVTAFVGGYLQYYDFRVERRDDIFEYERGLVSRQGGSIPKEKIQHVEISENFLMRHLGYATLKVETAGYTQAAETGTTSITVLMPFERSETVYRQARKLGEFEADRLDLDDLNDVGPIARRRYVRRYFALSTVLLLACLGLLFVGFHPGILVVPVLGFLLASPAGRLHWSNIGFRRGTHNLLVTRGFWVRTTYLVPHFRIQNLMVSQSLLQRRWGLATVTVDTAGNKTVNPKIPDLERDEADRVRRNLFEAFTESIYATPDSGTTADEPGTDSSPEWT